MSKYNWLKDEGQKWVAQQVITNEQYESIMQLYEGKKQSASIMPLLGSVLAALGVFSYVVANWESISLFGGVVLSIVTMLAFYLPGFYFWKKGDMMLGIGLTGVGLITFGSSIIFIEHLANILYNGPAVMIVWALAGIVLTYLLRSRFLFLLTLFVITGGQLYLQQAVNHFSYVLFALLLLGFGYYAWKFSDRVLSWLLSASLMLQALIWIGGMNYSMLWMFPVLFMLYIVGDVRIREEFQPFYTSGLIVGFGAVAIYTLNKLVEHPQSVGFAIWLAALLLFSFAVKYMRRDFKTMPDLLLFLPWFYIQTDQGIVALVMLFMYSLYVLSLGYREEQLHRVNLGTILFIVSTLTAYGKLTWELIPKSLFFLIGGILLILLSWLMNVRKKKMLGTGGEQHD